MLKCKICDMEWEQIPAHAQQVGSPRGGYRLYFIDGRLHDVGSTHLGRNKAVTPPQETQK